MTLFKVLAGIYIHIPFCKQACYYCDFHFSTNQKNKQALSEALVQELHLQQNYLKGEAIQSIYFGGGTPSLLKSEELSMILDAIKTDFAVDPTIECTLEANPDDLNESTLSQFRALGINRLSIGIQSFDNEILRSLNRVHTSDQAEACISNARTTGFDSLSCDLIYAIPGLSDAEWERSLHKMLHHHPEHISAYSLTIEENTVFGNWQRKGKLQTMDDDHAARQLELLVEILAANGYEQYEVSNFARNGSIAQHNTNYWKQQKYLGIGPSAHSFNGVSRQFNISNNNRYIKSIQSGSIPFTLEVLSREDKINEYLLTTLRTKWGSNLLWLKEELQYSLLEENSKYIEQLMDTKLATYQDHHLILTRKGMMMADRIASDLFVIRS